MCNAKRRPVGVVAALFVGVGLVAAGCAPASTASGSGGSSEAGTATDTGAGRDAGAVEARSLSCLSVIQCAIACGDGNDACQDECLARGTSDAQTKANAFAACLTTNACDTQTCVTDTCRTSYEACMSREAEPEGKPLPDTVPAGSVPSDLVGGWNSADVFGGAKTFTFNANGTASRKRVLRATIPGCISVIAIEDEGTAVFNAAGNAFTFYVASSKVTNNRCGVSETVPGTTGTYDFTTEPQPEQGPGTMWIFEMTGCTATNDTDKRVQCGSTYRRN